MDISTGQIYITSCSSVIQLTSEISRIHPSEILVNEKLSKEISLSSQSTITIVQPSTSQITQVFILYNKLESKY